MLREFHGSTVSEDFVMTINKRDGNVQVNLQEIMALRLEGHPFTTSDRNFQGKTCADIIGKSLNVVFSYGNMKEARSSEKWIQAREHFAGLNDLEEEKVKLLSEFTTQGSNANGSGSEKVKQLTKGDSQLLGLLIASSLPQDTTDYLLTQGIRNGIVQIAIWKFGQYLSESLREELEIRNAEQIRLAIVAEREKREAVKREALETFEDLGIDPTEEQLAKMIAKLESKSE